MIDDFNWEGLAIDVDFPLPAARVVRSLDQIIEWRGRPMTILCDNGPEYISSTLAAWAEKRAIQISFIQPGQTQQNAYTERYNRTVRYDWLAHYLFESVDEVRGLVMKWLWTDNHKRPNMTLGGITLEAEIGLCDLASLLLFSKTGGLLSDGWSRRVCTK